MVYSGLYISITYGVWGGRRRRGVIGFETGGYSEKCGASELISQAEAPFVAVCSRTRVRPTLGGVFIFQHFELHMPQ